jgi:predicted small lipoprotein YifL
MTLSTWRRMALLAAASACTLAACGQSGPLYLPGNPSRIQVETPATDDAGDAAEDGTATDD